MRHQHGFTLIEVTIFIVVLGVIATGLLAAFNISLRQQPSVQAITIANTLAAQRMEIILGQKAIAGFSSYSDPCSSPAVCSIPSGYTVTSTIATNWNSNTNYHVITVNVAGKATASLTTLVANYA